jgi:uncharacterized damage-inducible protein DinB
MNRDERGTMLVVGKPDVSEYAPYYGRYVSLVAGDDVLRALGDQIEQTLATLRGVTSERSLERYAPGKWSLRQVVGHVVDAERIFAYRALRFARNDRTELPGFEQDDYAAAARSDERPWADLLAELELVRRANILMLGALDREAWAKRGVASGNEVTVRALAYSIAGHELHHMGVVRTRYLAPGA